MNNRLRLKFKDDDDDLITLSTDEECLEAIRISTSLAAPVLKIYIEVHTEEPRVPRVRHDTEDVVRQEGRSSGPSRLKRLVGAVATAAATVNSVGNAGRSLGSAYTTIQSVCFPAQPAAAPGSQLAHAWSAEGAPLSGALEEISKILEEAKARGDAGIEVSDECSWSDAWGDALESAHESAVQRHGPLWVPLAAVGELLHDKDAYVRSAALGVLQACSAEERAPHIARVGELLHDEDTCVRSAALEVLQACSAEERTPYMTRMGELLNDKQS